MRSPSGTPALQLVLSSFLRPSPFGGTVSIFPIVDLWYLVTGMVVLSDIQLKLQVMAFFSPL